eukprot:14207187-Alexandrium_andersonii.AAC.1
MAGSEALRLLASTRPSARPVARVEAGAASFHHRLSLKPCCRTCAYREGIHRGSTRGSARA